MTVLLAGIVAGFAFFSFVFDVTLGSCFFEQGCGPYEGIKVAAIAAAAVLLSAGVVFFVSTAVRRFADSLERDAKVREGTE
jgi:hypothetical protein